MLAGALSVNPFHAKKRQRRRRAQRVHLKHMRESWEMRFAPTPNDPIFSTIGYSSVITVRSLLSNQSLIFPHHAPRAVALGRWQRNGRYRCDAGTPLALKGVLAQERKNWRLELAADSGEQHISTPGVGRRWRPHVPITIYKSTGTCREGGAQLEVT